MVVYLAYVDYDRWCPSAQLPPSVIAATAYGLLREAIDTHPQHFEAAVRSLRALEST